MKGLSKKNFAQVFFDLDGICQLKVYGKPALVEQVKKELGFYLTALESRPLTLDLEIELADLSSYQPSSNPADLPPYDFPYQHKLARGIIRFERLSQPPHRIRFYGNYFSRLTLAKQIIEPAIRWKAQELGFIFVHSTCLAKENKGVVLAGAGGSGKSRVLVHWLRKGNPFLSDDFTILSYGRARRYITPIRLGARLLWESGAREISHLLRFEIYFRTALRRLLFNYAQLQKKLEIKRLFPEVKILESVELKAIVLAEGSAEQRKEISPQEMVDLLLKVNQKEMYGFDNYLSGLAERAGIKELGEFFLVQKERLSHYLEELPCFLIPAPSRMSQRAINELLNWLEEFF